MEFDYSQALTHLMGHVMKLHRQTVDMLIQDYDVFPGQPPLLMRLAQSDGLIQKELARRINVKPATLTVMITRMEKAGLVVRKADQQDQRISRVYLTDKGRVATKAVKKALEEIEARSFENFSEEEKQVLGSMLQRVHDQLLAFNRESSRSGPYVKS